MSTMLRDTYASFILLPFICAAWFGIRNLRYADLQSVDPITFLGKAGQAMRSERIVQTAGKKLDVAKSHRAHWDVLMTTAGQLGFSYVGMSLDGMKFFKSFDESDETPAWLVTIPLTGGGRIELAHRFEKKGLAAISLGSFADILRTRVDLKRRSAVEQDSQDVVDMSNPWQKAVS